IEHDERLDLSFLHRGQRLTGTRNPGVNLVADYRRHGRPTAIEGDRADLHSGFVSQSKGRGFPDRACSRVRDRELPPLPSIDEFLDAFIWAAREVGDSERIVHELSDDREVIRLDVIALVNEHSDHHRSKPFPEAVRPLIPVVLQRSSSRRTRSLINYDQ